MATVEDNVGVKGLHENAFYPPPLLAPLLVWTKLMLRPQLWRVATFYPPLMLNIQCNSDQQLYGAQ